MSRAQNLLLPDRDALPSPWRRLLAACCCGALGTREELEALAGHERHSRHIGRQRMDHRRCLLEELHGRFWSTPLRHRNPAIFRHALFRMRAGQLCRLDNGLYLQHLDAIARALRRLREHEAAAVAEWSQRPDTPIPWEHLPGLVQALFNQRLDDRP